MTIGLFVNPRQYFRSSSGTPYSGYKLYTYLTGTTTPADTYADADGSNVNTNPIVLDSAGSCVIYLTEDVTYKFVLKDPTNTSTIFTTDPVVAYVTVGSLDSIAEEEVLTTKYALVDCDINETSTDALTLSPNGSGNTLISDLSLAYKYVNLNTNNVTFSDGKGFSWTGLSGPIYRFSVTGSATNYIEVAYVDDNYIDLKAAGDDANIDLIIQCSDAGTPMYFNNYPTEVLFPTSDGSAGQYLKYNGSSLSFGA